MKEFLVKMFTAGSGISSKRVMGTLGWITCVFICVYCTISKQSAPNIVETLFICSTSLLGVDSVIKMIRGYDKTS